MVDGRQYQAGEDMDARARVKRLHAEASLLCDEVNRHKAIAEREQQRAQRAEAECERLRDALRFYARHEHWMEITEGSDSRIVLVACGSTGNPNGWAEAEEALATPPREDEPCWRCNGKGEDPNCPVCDAENFDAPHPPRSGTRGCAGGLQRHRGLR